MAFRANAAKLGNLLKTRMHQFQKVFDVYKPSMIRSKDKFLEFLKERTEHATTTKLYHKLNDAKKYYKLEIAAPKLKSLNPKKILEQGEITQLVKDANLVKECFQNGCYQFFTVKQALLLILVAIEIVMWFFLGETIGKMHIVGYDV